MLDLMRKNAGSWIVKVLLGAIIVVFCFWGMGTYSARKAGRVAIVNGDTVTVSEYRQAYDRIMENLRRQLGNDISEETLEVFNVKQQAMDQVVNRRLLLQEAERLKFQVSNAELVAAVSQIGAFQGPAGFDRRRYERVLSRNRMTPEEFEHLQRQNMLLERLQTFISAGVKVSEEEVRQMFEWRDAQVDFEFVHFDPDAFDQIEADPAEVEAHFKARSEAYKTPPQVKVRYLKFDPRDYREQVNVSQEELREYYDSNPAEFRSQETVEARHILLKLDPDAPEETVEAVREKARGIADKARAGKDFAALAKQYSQGPSKDNGGSLGAFPRGAMVKPFEDQAFSMQAGEVSDPVRTRFGWHIIQVDKVNPESTRGFDEAREAIRAKLIGSRARNLAYDLAEELFDACFEDDDLEKVAGQRGLKSVATDLFDRQNPPQGIAAGDRFVEAALTLKDDHVSEVLDLGDAYYLMRVDERREARIPEFDSVREKVAEDVVQKKREEKARADAEALLEKLRSGQEMKAAARDLGRTAGESGFFKRNDSIPGLGREPDLTRQAFLLSSQNPLPEAPIKGSKGYYVLRFRDRRAPGNEDYETQREGIRRQLSEQKRRTSHDRFVTGVKARSTIEIEPDYRP